MSKNPTKPKDEATLGEVKEVIVDQKGPTVLEPKTSKFVDDGNDLTWLPSKS